MTSSHVDSTAPENTLDLALKAAARMWRECAEELRIAYDYQLKLGQRTETEKRELEHKLQLAERDYDALEKSNAQLSEQIRRGDIQRNELAERIIALQSQQESRNADL